MSILSDIEHAGQHIADFLMNIVKGGSALQKMWSQCGPQTIAVAAAVFYDVMKTAVAAEQAVQAGTTGNVLGTVSLSQQTGQMIQQLISDWKAGVKQVHADFDALNFNFKN